MDRCELMHHGIKGMKWGVRRYQNKDGTLTNAGQKRYERDQRDNKSKKKDEQFTSADAHRWVREDLSRSRRLVDETSGLTNKLKNANDSSMRNRQKAKMDLSSMTDQQMRNEINRALLERQYTDMFAPQTRSKGREYASKTLEVAGSVLAVGSSALGIALAIKELRG